jgi:hypothetical protein
MARFDADGKRLDPEKQAAEWPPAPKETPPAAQAAENKPAHQAEHHTPKKGK